MQSAAICCNLPSSKRQFHVPFLSIDAIERCSPCTIFMISRRKGEKSAGKRIALSPTTVVLLHATWRSSDAHHPLPCPVCDFLPGTLIALPSSTRGGQLYRRPSCISILLNLPSQAKDVFPSPEHYHIASRIPMVVFGIRRSVLRSDRVVENKNAEEAEGTKPKKSYTAYARIQADQAR